jgi:hypothetical protein
MPQLPDRPKTGDPAVKLIASGRSKARLLEERVGVTIRFLLGRQFGAIASVVGDAAEFGAATLHLRDVARERPLRVQVFVARQPVGCSMACPACDPCVERTWRTQCASLLILS